MVASNATEIVTPAQVCWQHCSLGWGAAARACLVNMAGLVSFSVRDVRCIAWWYVARLVLRTLVRISVLEFSVGGVVWFSVPGLAGDVQQSIVFRAARVAFTSAEAWYRLHAYFCNPLATVSVAQGFGFTELFHGATCG